MVCRFRTSMELLNIPSFARISEAADCRICPERRELSSFRAPLLYRPRLGDVELLEQPYRVALCHAGDEIAGRGIQVLLLDGSRIEERRRLMVDLLPQAGQDVGRFFELLCRYRVLVNRFEQ